MDSRIRIKNIESDIADHCNLSCNNCNHFAPHFSPGFYDVSDFKNDIHALASVIHVDKWYLLGGEPFLNPRLKEYVIILRESGICDQVDIWTNGLLLPKWTDSELFTLIDTIRISKYPGINYSALTTWQNNAALPCKIVANNCPSFFPSHSEHSRSEDEIRTTFDKCEPRRECNQVYRGHYYLCSYSFRLPAYLKLQSISDGCAIHAPNLNLRLQEFLSEAKSPLDTCQFCTAYDEKRRPVKQVVIPNEMKISFQK